jgi:signal peptidase II
MSTLELVSSRMESAPNIKEATHHSRTQPRRNDLGMIRLGLLAAISWFVVDQATKWWIVNHVMVPPRVIPVTDFFNIILGRNTGVSFGLLGGMSQWLLVALASAVLVMLLIWMSQATSRIVVLALGLIAGGAIGNIVDRLRLGGVTDFLDLYLGEWHWPAFNMADVGIVCGAGLLLAESVIFGKAQASGDRA